MRFSTIVLLSSVGTVLAVPIPQQFDGGVTFPVGPVTTFPVGPATTFPVGPATTFPVGPATIFPVGPFPARSALIEELTAPEATVAPAHAKRVADFGDTLDPLASGKKQASDGVDGNGTNDDDGKDVSHATKKSIGLAETLVVRDVGGAQVAQQTAATQVTGVAPQTVAIRQVGSAQIVGVAPQTAAAQGSGAAPQTVAVRQVGSAQVTSGAPQTAATTAQVTRAAL